MSAVTGAGLGLALGAGALLTWTGRPWRRPGLAGRVEPYLGRTVAPGPLRRWFAALAGRPSGIGPGADGITPWSPVVADSPGGTLARLHVLDPRADLGRFRAQQVVCAALGGALTLLLAGGAAWHRGLGPTSLLALLVAGAAGGAAARDRALTVAVRRRRRRMVEEFAVVAELLALSVAAGEDVLAALHRVSAARGPLGDAVREVLAEVGTGTTVVDALVAMARRSGVVELERFADAVAVAVVRGSPLAGVLRAQAADARDAERRRLLEEGGRKEVLMLVPVVFLVLPTTVVFAVYPGVSSLSLGP
ncbi:type II secretion system F family protein [Kineococcus gynurae]|uniref:Type II secretion system F family protein n=1 Tax=Kineococcus gynurae TaxID=452979 RepID=A0ABV5LX67_9ACTN